jgi:hypothetical protein
LSDLDSEIELACSFTIAIPIVSTSMLEFNRRRLYLAYYWEEQSVSKGIKTALLLSAKNTRDSKQYRFEVIFRESDKSWELKHTVFDCCHRLCMLILLGKIPSRFTPRAIYDILYDICLTVPMPNSGEISLGREFWMSEALRVRLSRLGATDCRDFYM